MKKLYLLATYYKVPRYPKMSSQKDYGKDEANWAFNESVEIVRVIKKRDQQQASVILNLVDKCVEKCSMRPDATYEDLHRYYKANYPQYFQHLDILDVAPTEAVENTAETAAPAETAPAATA